MAIDKTFSQFCLGTVQFGKSYGLKNVRDKEIEDYEIKDIFDFFYSKGGMYIDTAQNYGNSEKRISKCLNQDSRIISKLYLTDTHNQVEQLIYESLDNLKIARLDTILIHNPEILLQAPKLIDDLIDLKERQLVNNIGISIYSFDDIPSNSFLANKDILSNIDVIQVQGNAFDKNFFLNKDFLSILNNNIRIDIRSIFLQGLLLQDIEPALKLFPIYSDELLDWHNYCLKNSLSKIEASILNMPKIPNNNDSLTLFGCRHLSEIDEIYKSIINLDDIKYERFSCDFPKALIDPRCWK